MNKIQISIITFLLCLGDTASAQTNYLPQIHGILRGKYEYQPDLDASRFEVRNARLSVDGNLPFRSSYKLEVDLCDESAIKMKDAWVRVNPVNTLRITLGQQRMPFSIDAHRNPSAQYFANRSFIAKQVGDMRDVGAAVGYDVVNADKRKVLSLDAGIYNGSNLDNQKTAWFSSPAYSARIQYFMFLSYSSHLGTGIASLASIFALNFSMLRLFSLRAMVIPGFTWKLGMLTLRPLTTMWPWLTIWRASRRVEA